eukprot:Gb_02986 [translate_table: standard]
MTPPLIATYGDMCNKRTGQVVGLRLKSDELQPLSHPLWAVWNTKNSRACRSGWPKRRDMIIDHQTFKSQTSHTLRQHLQCSTTSKRCKVDLIREGGFRKEMTRGITFQNPGDV